MYLEEIANYKELKRKKRNNSSIAYNAIKEFINLDCECVRVIDCEHEFNNYGDVRRTFQNIIENSNFNVEVFMINGSVYLRRKDGKDR